VAIYDSTSELYSLLLAEEEGTASPKGISPVPFLRIESVDCNGLDATWLARFIQPNLRCDSMDGDEAIGLA